MASRRGRSRDLVAWQMTDAIKPSGITKRMTRTAVMYTTVARFGGRVRADAYRPIRVAKILKIMGGDITCFKLHRMLLLNHHDNHLRRSLVASKNMF
jgi:hypothetical protein